MLDICGISLLHAILYSLLLFEIICPILSLSGTIAYLFVCPILSLSGTITYLFVCPILSLSWTTTYLSFQKQLPNRTMISLSIRITVDHISSSVFEFQNCSEKNDGSKTTWKANAIKERVLRETQLRKVLLVHHRRRDLKRL